jgi:hypothetical protein
VSDRGTQFTSRFWQKLHESIDGKITFLRTWLEFHPYHLDQLFVTNVLGRYVLSCFTWAGYKWFRIQSFVLWNAG